ncbi:DNA-binding MarR family transcriptional regulator [Microbacterium endophyticum]|uniref:DNA-binding MarR family transcriptional regulator n=1 Tax=Microbacterium endophyticum TaxID=1526412 RepID=A0A7W4V317_9MICO|nr:MarR family transcriptional regulator [Microbacterium endophyticum]MBB2975891.1 DNA-binding MarR family transcriptional regulator [Microbacterium endophyticum]NIK36374.1 DNA-binding MarR family transcriptional regulator [Microbacterium endophyticum]
MTESSGHRDDDVDLLIDVWSRLLPDVDLTPLDVMSRLRRASHRLAVLRARAFASAELRSWEFDVLAALRRDEHGELSPSQLIEATMIGSAAMTTRLDKLSGRGLIVRRPSPRDGRGVLVTITTEGADRVDGAMRELARTEAEALSGVSRSDQATLARVLRMLS